MKPFKGQFAFFLSFSMLMSACSNGGIEIGKLGRDGANLFNPFKPECPDCDGSYQPPVVDDPGVKPPVVNPPVNPPVTPSGDNNSGGGGGGGGGGSSNPSGDNSGGGGGGGSTPSGDNSGGGGGGLNPSGDNSGGGGNTGGNNNSGDNSSAVTCSVNSNKLLFISNEVVNLDVTTNLALAKIASVKWVGSLEKKVPSQTIQIPEGAHPFFRDLQINLPSYAQTVAAAHGTGATLLNLRVNNIAGIVARAVNVQKPELGMIYEGEGTYTLKARLFDKQGKMVCETTAVKVSLNASMLFEKLGLLNVLTQLQGYRFQIPNVGSAISKYEWVLVNKSSGAEKSMASGTMTLDNASKDARGFVTKANLSLVKLLTVITTNLLGTHKLRLKVFVKDSSGVDRIAAQSDSDL